MHYATLCTSTGTIIWLRNGTSMGQVNIKTPNPKCRLYWCLIELIDLRYSQSCWLFSTPLVNNAPLIFSLVHLPPPFPVLISTGVCINTVCNRGGGIRLCAEHIQELYTVYLTRFWTYNNYLCTYDLYGPIRNVFDACRSITRASGRELGPWNPRLFWALWNGIKPLGECHFGLKKVEISRAQPPPTCPSNGFVHIKKNYWQGHINHRCIGSFMYKSSHGSLQGA